MELLRPRRHRAFTLTLRMALVVLLSLSISACTTAFTSKHVASIPLVMLRDVPIPEAAKQRDVKEQTLNKDTALSIWFMGAEGWQTDALAQGLQSSSARQSQASYFEAHFETLFLAFLAFNYEKVLLQGHWVQMVPQELPHLKTDRAVPLESDVPAQIEKKQ